MVEFKKDETKRMLGRRRHVCKICGAEGNFETYLAREMMQDTKDEFEYFACDQCNCLQISEVPENLGDYYGGKYYSMTQPEEEEMEFTVPAVHWQKVLDVGCGSGYWLVQKAREGWENLYGCDPFLDHDRHYGDRVRIRSCSIHEMEGDGSFDVIRMHDSFEHMADPLEVLKNARRLLKADGLLVMTIPIYPNIAFEKYGPHWFQLDAPRHIFLHSKESLEYLAKKVGLSVTGWKYQSNMSQFIRSYFYQHGIPFYEQEKLVNQYFSAQELNVLALESDRANAKEYGDYAAVNMTVGELPVEESGSRVIYQCFRREKSRYAYPYPPVYRDADTDYICFTTEDDIESGHWKVQKTVDLEPETLELYLKKYHVRRELEQDQIQMDTLFNTNWKQSFVNVPSLEELPRIQLDLSHFEPTADENGHYKYEKNPVYQKGKYKGRPLLLTIGVPVSNQIETIDRCLSHVKPLLDQLDAELVVIDTGSTDGTIEVCKSYGARGYEHPWHDNMSAVRNEAIRHGRGLWYMSIDDDEWFEDVEDILRFFKSGEYKQYNAATYIQRNYMDSKGTMIHDMYTLRMAEITPELHFEGRIHDALCIKGNVNAKQLSSYAHHYGFVNEPEKVQVKSMRNTPILLLDVYEYPEDCRYLFQLGNEFKSMGENVTAMGLFAQYLSLYVHFGMLWQVESPASGLVSCLYTLRDKRLFTWADNLSKVFRLLITDQCYYAFLMMELAFSKGMSAREVLTYHERYENLLEKYEKDPSPWKKTSYYGLAVVEDKFYAAGACVVAFGACLRLGDEEKAMEILKNLDLEAAKGKRKIVLEEGFTAGPEVFAALCAKLTPSQWEEWGGTVLNAFVAGMTRYAVAEQQKARFPEILTHLSVSAIEDWLAASEFGKRRKAREKLVEYALEVDEAGRFTDGEISLQELTLCARVLMEAYENAAPGGELESEEKRWQLLKAYIMAEGALAERYHTPEQLLEPEGGEISPRIRAVYCMAMALADGVASSENVALLKQALKVYPAYHQEIRGILAELR